LDLLADSGLVRKDQLSNPMKESRELTAIFTASGKAAKRNR